MLCCFPHLFCIYVFIRKRIYILLVFVAVGVYKSSKALESLPWRIGKGAVQQRENDTHSCVTGGGVLGVRFVGKRDTFKSVWTNRATANVSLFFHVFFPIGCFLRSCIVLFNILVYYNRREIYTYKSRHVSLHIYGSPLGFCGSILLNSTLLNLF